MSIFGWTFQIEEWTDDDCHYETIAAANNITVAIAAYEAALKEKPGANLMLRNGARIVRNKGVRTGDVVRCVKDG